MPTPTKNRVAWFLGLQRAWTFPKYFLAPQFGKPRKPDVLREEDQPAGSRHHAGYSSPTAANTRVRHARPDRQMSGLATRQSASRGSLTTQLVAPPLPGRAIEHPKVKRADVGITSGRSPMATRPPNVSRIFVPISARTAAVSRPTAAPAGRTLGTTIVKYSSPAARPAIFRSLQLGQLQQHAARKPLVSVSPESTLRVPPPSAIAEFTSEPSFESRSQPSSPKPQTDRAGDRQRQDNGRTSTVHLDGAALGQWTIRHLERALARPASGMTGVDPRASPPRGRVSPF